MKKVLIISLITISVLMLAGCGSKNDNKGGQKTENKPLTINEKNCPGTGCEYHILESDTEEDAENYLPDSNGADGITIMYEDEYQNLKNSNEEKSNVFIGVLHGDKQVGEENIVLRAFACGLENGKMVCIEGSTDDSKYESNKEILKKVYNDKCSEQSDIFSCSGDLDFDVYKFGKVEVNDSNGYGCEVTEEGAMLCW